MKYTTTLSLATAIAALALIISPAAPVQAYEIGLDNEVCTLTVTKDGKATFEGNVPKRDGKMERVKNTHDLKGMNPQSIASALTGEGCPEVHLINRL